MRLFTLLTTVLLSVAVAVAAPDRLGARAGDVNGDGEANISDVNSVINGILSGFYLPNCDVNGDGEVNIADVNFVIDIILNGTPDPVIAESGMYMGIMGFNQALSTRPIAFLDSTTISSFNNYVNGLSTQNGRLLYYAVDKGLDELSSADQPENLQNVALVTVTGGLDQGSLMMTDKYETEAEYAAALNDRITRFHCFERPLKAYTVGLLNSNIGDQGRFMDNLYALSSDSSKATAVENMAEVNARFQAIADDLVSRNMSEKLILTFPGVGTGTRIRFTFDELGGANAANSQEYIEGVFSLKDRSLTDIEYHGMTCTAGETVTADSVSGMFVSMTFDGIQLNSGERISKRNIQEWYWIESEGAWQMNTEFSSSDLPEIEQTYSSALVMLLLDCSTALDEQFPELQSAANAFIERMEKYNTVPGMFNVNGVSFRMITVDGGTFEMGSTDEQANIDESPVHEVTLETYSIGQTEVTQELWQAVMGSNPSNFTGNPQRPVEQVSWEDCQEFIAKLNALTGKTFRLPTEAEWEYAARGGSKSKGYTYAGSNNVNEVAWMNNNSNNRTQVVGTKQSNELGLYDMCGNVFEWCSDWYGDYSAEPQLGPVGPENGIRRVTRGGSWFSVERDARSTFRSNEAPTTRSYTLGLRLAM